MKTIDVLRTIVRTMMMAAGLLTGIACLSFLLAVLSFVGQIQASAYPVKARADVIVVFSGDPARFSAALSLLENGVGRRLLVVGQDNSAEIEAARATRPALVGCCIEHDPRSQNTSEDARNAGNWILANHVKSVIVVTSKYHIPRAMLELRRVSPKTNIRPFGAMTESFAFATLWHEPLLAQPLLSEFLKYAPRSVLGEIGYGDDPRVRKTFHYLFELGSKLLCCLGR